MTAEINEELSRSDRIFRFLERFKDSVDLTISYEEFEQGCGMDVRQFRSALEAARCRLLRTHKRDILNVWSVGYRVAHPREAEDRARGCIRSSKKKVGKGYQALVNADRSLLTLAEGKQHDHVTQVVAGIRETLRKHEKRLDQHERLISDTRDRVRTLEKTQPLTADEVADLRALLKQ